VRRVGRERREGTYPEAKTLRSSLSSSFIFASFFSSCVATLVCMGNCSIIFVNTNNPFLTSISILGSKRREGGRTARSERGGERSERGGRKRDRKREREREEREMGNMQSECEGNWNLV
jgi:hypothetical protein